MYRQEFVHAICVLRQGGTLPPHSVVRCWPYSIQSYLSHSWDSLRSGQTPLAYVAMPSLKGKRKGISASASRRRLVVDVKWHHATRSRSVIAPRVRFLVFIDWSVRIDRRPLFFYPGVPRFLPAC